MRVLLLAVSTALPYGMRPFPRRGWKYFLAQRLTLYSLLAGEEVYLFLWGKPGEAYRVLGWAQGTFRIIRDARTGTEKITQESSSANFDQRTLQFHGDGIRGMAVPVFQEKLRQALGRGLPREH